MYPNPFKRCKSPVDLPLYKWILCTQCELALLFIMFLVQSRDIHFYSVFVLIVCDILFTNAYMQFKGRYIKKCHVICERVLSFLFNFFIFLSSTVQRPTYQYLLPFIKTKGATIKKRYYICIIQFKMKPQSIDNTSIIT